MQLVRPLIAFLRHTDEVKVPYTHSVKVGGSRMARIVKLLKSVSKDENGAAMAEYVVLLGLIVGALVFVITNFATVLQGKFASVCAALGGSC